MLTRDEFRLAVFKRDNNKCIICGNKGTDAHHIIERKLWSDGGYYVDNGATLCEDCHILAESTEISVDRIRKCAKIETVLVPPGFPENIDKWGFLDDRDCY